MTPSFSRTATLLVLPLFPTACLPDPCKTTGISIQTGEVFETIEDAAQAAGSGGTVSLCAGTFHGGLIALMDGTSLVGVGATETVITLRTDPDEASGVVVVFDEPRVTISGVTITGGRNAPTADTGIAGAVAPVGGKLLFDDVRLVDNVATFGGAIGIGNLEDYFTSVTIRDSEISANEALGGAAIALWSAGTVTVENTDFGTTGTNENDPNDIEIYASLPFWDEPSSEPLAAYDFEGVVSFTCEWETATCE